MTQINTSDDPSFGSDSLRIPSAPSLKWSSMQLEDQYVQCLTDYRSGAKQYPPPTPEEVFGLVETGRWETAVRRLDFIFSCRLLEKRWSDSHPGVAARMLDKLQEAVDHPERLRLSKAEHAVCRMLYMLVTEGLDSFHPNDKALNLVKEYAHVLDENLDPRFSKGGRWSYRVWGAASLLSAQASLQEALQPGGIAVLEAARAKGIPRIMFPSHHVVGGDAVELIAEFCTRHGILRGNILCDRMIYDMPNPDIFLLSKDLPDNWRKPIKALCELAAGRSGDILIVEDELRSRNQDGNPINIEAFITAAYEGQGTLLFARDYREALDIMNSQQVAAVGSDLYIPEKTGTCARGDLNELGQKGLGNRLVHRILDEFLSQDTVDDLLLKARRMEMSIYQRMRSELSKVIGL